MSHYDYVKSREIEGLDFSFASIIMAAARKADDNNLMKLRSVFPTIVEELKERYNSPGGLLPHEKDENPL